MATIWSPADESDACNSDLVVAIIEVIARNMIMTENHLISPEDLFGLNLKQLKKKLWKIIEIGPHMFLSPADALERKKERGDGEESKGGGGGVSLTLGGGSYRLYTGRFLIILLLVVGYQA
jgi:hypothetical protein